MTERKKRVGSTERLPLAEAKDAYPMQLTARDKLLLMMIFLGWALTTQQLARLFFPSLSACIRRLRLLFQNGFLFRLKIGLHQLGLAEEDGPQETLLHTLDEQGAKVVAQELAVPVETIWKPSDRKIPEQQLKHLIVNNDVRIAIKLAAEALDYTVKNWETDQTFRRKRVEQKWVVDFVPSYGTEPETGEIVPDDYLTIVTPEHRYFNLIEIDTGSEVRQPKQRPRGKDTSVATKIRRYISFFHKEKRSEPSNFEKLTGQQQKGIRVFFVTTGGEKALDNLLSSIKAVGGRNSYWATRYDLARREDLVLTRPIWRKAGDDEPAYYPWIGMSNIEKLRFRLKQSGVAASELEARIGRITDLAKTQLLDGVGEWNERKMGMSLAQAVALRADELAEATLERFDRKLNQS